MRKRILPLFLWLIISIPAFSQYDYRIFGYVTNEQTGEPLIGAKVNLPDWRTETYTNNFGYFSISVPPQDFNIEYSFAGFKTRVDSMFVDSDNQVNISLKRTVIDESQINDLKKSQSDITNPICGKIDVPTGLLKELPYLLSEPDLVKGLQNLPGIAQGAEFGSSLYIRGGGGDQNLTLLDGVQVYNGTHLFGYLSIFQPDITNSLQVYKAGFPARYGGRVSSVIDITSNEGTNHGSYGSASLGLFLAKVAIQGPLGKNQKTTYSFGMRRSWWDAFTIFQQQANKGRVLIVSDYNLKLKHKLKNHDYIMFSVYAGRDKWPGSFIDSTFEVYNDLHYSNMTSVLRWNHTFSPKLFSNLSVGTTRYKVKNAYSESFFDSALNAGVRTTWDYKNGITDIIANADFEYSASNTHFFRFGLQNNNHLVNTGYSKIESTDKTSSSEESGTKKASYIPEIALYLEDDFKLNDKVKVNMGLRTVAFINNAYNYNKIFIEPRISGRYILSQTAAIKASYSRMNQTMFLLTNSGIDAPLSFWAGATQAAPAQQSDNINIALAKELKNGYNLSVDAYFKQIKNINFTKEDPGVVTIDADWQKNLEIGKSHGYGLEMMIQKSAGYLTGWLSYTLAFANQKYDNINLGKAFEFSYNRRNTVNLVMNYRLSESNSIFMSLTLASGRRFTIPGGKYLDIDGNSILDYRTLNNYKGPFFQRLDLGCIFVRSHYSNADDHQLYLTLFNALLAKNPINIYTDYVPSGSGSGTGSYKVYSTSAPFFIPGITYILKF